MFKSSLEVILPIDFVTRKQAEKQGCVSTIYQWMEAYYIKPPINFIKCYTKYIIGKLKNRFIQTKQK